MSDGSSSELSRSQSATTLRVELRGIMMYNGGQSLLSPLRIKIPFLMDLVIVSDPDQIRRIEASGDVDRLHTYRTADLPWWVRTFFRSTKFHDDKRDLWFCPFEPASNPTYRSRRAYLEQKVAEGYSPGEVQKMADLLMSNADEEALAYAMVQIINRRFLGREIPDPVCRAAKNTLQNLGEALVPGRYGRARRSREQILEFCEQNLDPHVHILDVGHNIGEAVQASAPALRRLKENLDQPIEEIFTRYAPTDQVPRIATRASRLGGLLWFSTKPGKTVVILKVAKAAARSHDLYFTFGTGKPERSCVFMRMFLEFMKELQAELRTRQARTNGAG
jgi:hypothetical protein